MHPWGETRKHELQLCDSNAHPANVQGRVYRFKIQTVVQLNFRLHIFIQIIKNIKCIQL